MERKFTSKLIEWKNDIDKLPLMLIGARQVGKTYIIKKFAEDYYEDLVYLNFEQEKDLIEFFENSLNPEKIVNNIEEYIGRKIIPETTLIIFDEIQKSERAINSLKYFAESDIKYNVITAGSLLGVKINRFESSFPVRKSRYSLFISFRF